MRPPSNRLGPAALLLLSTLLASPTLAQDEDACPQVAHQAWLRTCLMLVGGKHASVSAWPSSRGDYYAEADLAAELSADCADWLASDPRAAPAEPAACTWDSHVSWFQACVGQVEGLVGHTRAELLKVVEEEGGISTNRERNYMHRRCFPLKVEATFEVPDGSTEESADDRVAKVVPYVGYMIVD